MDNPLILVAVAIAGFFGYRYMQDQKKQGAISAAKQAANNAPKAAPKVTNEFDVQKALVERGSKLLSEGFTFASGLLGKKSQ